MGIKGLNEFIRNNTENSFLTFPIKQLKGLRIAIDANNLLYRHRAIAIWKVVKSTDLSLNDPDEQRIRVEWFSSLLSFAKTWLINKVTPVFVLDGLHSSYKDAVKKERRRKNEVLEGKIKVIREQVRGVKNVFRIDKKLLNDYAKLLCQRVVIDQSDYSLFYHCFRGLGIPVIQATGDGERLCATLFVEKKVGAVFSSDRDTLLHGCSILITDLLPQSRKGQDKEATFWYLPNILYELNLKGLAQLVDFGILCGTDYNDKLRGYGVERIYKLIQEYIYIHLMPEELISPSLRHRACRELFSRYPSSYLIRKTFTGDEFKGFDLENNTSEEITLKFKFDQDDTCYSESNLFEKEEEYIMPINCIDTSKNVTSVGSGHLFKLGLEHELGSITALLSNIGKAKDGYPFEIPEISEPEWERD